MSLAIEEAALPGRGTTVGRGARADIMVIDPSSSGTLRNLKVSGVLDVMLDVMTIDILTQSQSFLWKE